MIAKPTVRRIEDIDLDRAERQKRIRGWNQNTISNCAALVAGAGALGNEIVKNLIQLGLERIYLVDYDHVIKSNLNRCVFFRSTDADEGKFKAEVVAKRAMEINASTEVVPIVDDLEKIDKTIYRDTALIFGGVDSLAARMQVNIDSYLNQKPLIDGGIEGFQGQVQVVLPPKSPCIECSIGEREKKLIWSRLSCTGQYVDVGERKMPALPTTTSLIAAIQVQEGIKIIFGLEDYMETGRWSGVFGEPLVGKRLFYSANANTYRIYEVAKNPKCNLCSVEI